MYLGYSIVDYFESLLRPKLAQKGCDTAGEYPRVPHSSQLHRDLRTT
jgi:hypothetical protein